MENEVIDTAVAVQGAEDLATISTLAEGFLQKRDLATFAVAFSRNDGVEATEFVPLSNIPASFLQHYAENDYYLLDPLARFCLRTSTPFVWQETLILDNQPTIVRRIYSEAAEFGLPNGFTMPIRTANGLRGTVTFAGPRETFGVRERHELALLALVMHNRVGELCHDINVSSVRLHLTDREQEALRWGSQGKTSEDIADIMGLTKRTVDQHFENAARKLGTGNRLHTVVKAFRHNLITN